jgi:hypothetical protein
MPKLSRWCRPGSSNRSKTATRAPHQLCTWSNLLELQVQARAIQHIHTNYWRRVYCLTAVHLCVCVCVRVHDRRAQPLQV